MRHMTDAQARRAIALGEAVTYSTAQGWHHCNPARHANDDHQRRQESPQGFRCNGETPWLEHQRDMAALGIVATRVQP